MSSSSPAARAHPLIGVRAVVTTSIPAGGFGEIRVPHRGGTGTFPAECRVTVVEVHPPRTLVVAADG